MNTQFTARRLGRLIRHLLASTVVALTASAALHAQWSTKITELISYQGVIDSAGVKITNSDPDNLTFNIYPAVSSVIPRWSETDTVTITNGLFSVVLGQNSPLSILPFDTTYYLEVTYNPPGTPITFPRVQLTASAFSFRAEHADTVDGAVFWELNASDEAHLRTPSTGSRGAGANRVLVGTTDGTSFAPESGALGVLAVDDDDAAIVLKDNHSGSGNAYGVLATDVSTTGGDAAGVATTLVAAQGTGIATGFYLDSANVKAGSTVSGFRARQVNAESPGGDAHGVLIDQVTAPGNSGNAYAFRSVAVQAEGSANGVDIGLITAPHGKATGFKAAAVSAIQDRAIGLDLENVSSTDNLVVSYGAKVINMSPNGQQYGVYGEVQSTNTTSSGAGVAAVGAGSLSPGSPAAAALEVQNGAIRVTGTDQPAGRVLVPWPPAGQWCTTITVPNNLVNLGSSIIATVELAPGIGTPVPSDPWVVTINNVVAGAFTADLHALLSCYGNRGNPPGPGYSLWLNYVVASTASRRSSLDRRTPPRSLSRSGSAVRGSARCYTRGRSAVIGMTPLLTHVDPHEVSSDW